MFDTVLGSEIPSDKIGGSRSAGSVHRPVAALPVRHASMMVEVCPEIEQLVFEIRRGPE